MCVYKGCAASCVRGALPLPRPRCRGGRCELRAGSRAACGGWPAGMHGVGSLTCGAEYLELRLSGTQALELREHALPMFVAGGLEGALAPVLAGTRKPILRAEARRPGAGGHGETTRARSPARNDLRKASFASASCLRKAAACLACHCCCSCSTRSISARAAARSSLRMRAVSTSRSRVTSACSCLAAAASA